tara:strand:+ start:769 stop:1557 length:789 start_codon:yes stop_codon:yes gene_type:complete
VKSLSSIAADRLKDVRVVAFDIDDTITTEGRVTADAYRSLWQLQSAGLVLLAVTGRPAGWCDLIARAWPVDGVVGENGAFAYLRKGREIHRFDVAPPPTSVELKQMEDGLLQQFPDLALASDQFCRRFDLAIDFAEEVGPFSLSVAEAVKKAFEKEGWTAKVSSIHVNGWKGAWDKASTLSSCLADHYQLGPEHLAYVGDSPNDAPMFALAALSVGVANIQDFPALETPPEFVTRTPQGAGFSEFAQLLLRAQGFTFDKAFD